ncbi:MAG: gamma-glutamyl-gamma-aminobutyrate hydrolase family protein [Bacteroidetes bacterium]|nr:gamma-glutamyl-gamma-aminobutyrate hydrolase family protein [Bacteroidota bacterium]
MRIGISQRVDTVPHYHEVRDGLDHQWIPFLEQIGLQVVLIPNRLKDPAAYYRDLNIQGLVLSGGNDPAVLENASNVSEARDETESKLIEEARNSGHSIVGVCRGMQFLCLTFGESLSRIEGHVAQRHSLICSTNFNYPNGIEVNSYHNWALKTLTDESHFERLAYTADQSIEAVKHQSEPIYGIMWHPEREAQYSEYDLNFFKNIFTHD